MINLKEFRNRKGLAQMDMAKKLGVAMNTYILWERGISKPNEENQLKIKELIENSGD